MVRPAVTINKRNNHLVYYKLVQFNIRNFFEKFYEYLIALSTTLCKNPSTFLFNDLFYVF